jgi:hypothetical protein
MLSPEHKVGQDGKIIIRMLMGEMAHKTPQITFHPTNSASSTALIERYKQ